MNRAQAIAALDEAFADGVKRLFGLLVQRLEGGEDHSSVLTAFQVGVTFHSEAYALAKAAVETIFPE